jgi:hypothetical protein
MNLFVQPEVGPGPSLRSKQLGADDVGNVQEVLILEDLKDDASTTVVEVFFNFGPLMKFNAGFFPTIFQFANIRISRIHHSPQSASFFLRQV